MSKWLGTDISPKEAFIGCFSKDSVHNIADKFGIRVKEDLLPQALYRAFLHQYEYVTQQARAGKPSELAKKHRRMADRLRALHRDINNDPEFGIELALELPMNATVPDEPDNKAFQRTIMDNLQHTLDGLLELATGIEAIAEFEAQASNPKGRKGQLGISETYLFFRYSQ